MKKDKVLFMLGSYYNQPFANGICTRKLVLEFLNRDFDVDVLCYTNSADTTAKTQDGANIFFVKNMLSLRLVNYARKNNNILLEKFGFLLYRIKKIIYYPLFNVVSPFYYFNYLKKAKILMKNKEYSIIISVFQPIEALLSGKRLKEKNPNVKYILYTLDTLTNKKINNSIINNIDKKIGYKIEKKTYQKADLIINMLCHKDHYSIDFYNNYKDKMVILDIPLLCNNQNKSEYCHTILNPKKINFIYSGWIPSNPTPYCDFFTKLNTKNSNIVLNFFGRGSWDSVLNNISKSQNNIINHGYIEHSTLMKAFEDADGFISWQKKDTQMVSSKVLEYMSTGKKIIHFYSTSDDVMLYYIGKYDNSLLINLNDDYNTNIKKTIEFINNKNKEIDFRSIRKKLKENTPEYTVDTILKKINYKKGVK